jgi:hypothetical protein
VVKGRVELYLYSPYGPYGLYRASLPVQGCTLVLLYPPEHTTRDSDPKGQKRYCLILSLMNTITSGQFQRKTELFVTSWAIDSISSTTGVWTWSALQDCTAAVYFLVTIFQCSQQWLVNNGFRRNGRNLFEEVPQNFLMEHEKKMRKTSLNVPGVRQNYEQRMFGTQIYGLTATLLCLVTLLCWSFWRRTAVRSDTK